MKENCHLIINTGIKLFVRILFMLLICFLVGCDGDKDTDIDYDTPYNLEISLVEEGRIKLSWSYRSSSADVTYIIARKTGDEEWNDYYNLSSNNNKEFFDNIPTNSYNVYSYKVKAELTTSNTDTTVQPKFSETVSFFPEITKPTNLNVVQISQEQLLVTWDDNVVGESGYKIDRKINNQNWVLAYSSLAKDATEFSDTINESVNTIAYRVYAFVSQSNSPSNEISFTPTLHMPNNLSATQISGTQVSLEWQYTGDNPNSFEIQRKVGTNDWSNLRTVLGSFNEYVDIPLYDSATLSYRIRAVKDTSFSSYSNEAKLNFNLQEISSININDSGNQIVFHNSHVFIANNYSGVKIYNVSNPTNPNLVSSFNVSGKTTSVAASNNRLFVINDFNLFQVYDINNLSSPDKLHEIELPGEGNNVVLAIVNQQNYALVASGTAGLIIVALNHQDFNYPIPIKIINTLGNCVNLHFQDNRVYIADDQNGVLVYDISDIENEYPVRHLTNIGNANSIYIRNDFLYVTLSNNGFSVYNKNTFASISQIDTQGFASSIFVENNNIYLADKHNGFLIYSASNPLTVFSLSHLDFEENVLDVFVRNRYAYISTDNSFKIIQIRP